MKLTFNKDKVLFEHRINFTSESKHIHKSNIKLYNSVLSTASTDTQIADINGHVSELLVKSTALKHCPIMSNTLI